MPCLDLQVNGGWGTDFSSPTLTAESFANVCRRLAASGVTAFLPTLITAPPALYQRNLRLIASVLATGEFASLVPGLHLEGPFIAATPGFVGAHPPAAVAAPSTALLDDLLGWADGRVRLLTLAAEVPGAAALCAHARRHGVVVAIGHSNFTTADLDQLAAAGASALTHLGNALPATLPKFANPLWHGLAHPAYTPMFIPDGHHIPLAVLRLLLRARGTADCILVSDASPVAGLPPGHYHTLGNDAELSPDGRLFNAAKGCLVGSSMTLPACLARLAGEPGFAPCDLAQMTWANPARLLGLATGTAEPSRA